VTRAFRPPTALVLAVLGVTLAAALVLATGHGLVSIAPGTVMRIIANHLGLARFTPSWPPEHETILLTLRLPRVLAAALVGGALATAGTLFQGLLRNPLADPYVVGTSGGAALGGVLGMMLGSTISVLGFSAVPVMAFLGALATTLLVVRLASTGGRLPMVSVLLAGIAVSTLMGYVVSALLLLSERLQFQLPEVYAWLLGRIPEPAWSQLALIGALTLGGVAGSLGLARTLNALSLGEDGAARLGVHVERDKRLILALGALLTAAAVSVSGLIGFVGLIVPHMVRLVCGPDHRRLLPAAALAGAAFLVLADLLARTLVPPAEMPLGVVTAFVGGPFFLWLLRRSRREYEW
jgi:iron complex transport system permease protein